jgi:DNA mismatch repair protein MutS2
MTFAEKDTVYIIPLRKNGTITKVLNSDFYEVAVGSMLMKCRGGDLKTAKSPTPHGTTRNSQPKYHIKRTRLNKEEQALDLHGLKVNEALKLVEDRIDKAVLAQVDQLEIIHGIGTGKIQRALHKYLHSLSVVKHFKIDQKNPGTTWVYF